MSHTDLILYVDQEATIDLLQHLQRLLSAERIEYTALGAVLRAGNGAAYLQRTRERMWDLDWGNASGILIANDGVGVRSFEEPAYSSPLLGHEVTEARSLVPGRLYEAADGVLRTYEADEVGNAHWSWWVGDGHARQRLTAKVEEVAGPWRETEEPLP